jgi:lysophospholipase L1-like esterase
MLARLARLAVPLAAALATAGCTGSEPAPVEPEPEPPFARYVALGDSFTAAPLVPTTDVARGCFRSDGNYPALVAEALDVTKTVDVSCSGADTGDLLRAQETVAGARVPPQLRVVTAATDLVTVGIGGNDFGLYGSLVGIAYGRDPSEGAAELTGRIGERVEAALRVVRRRAPDATVLLVGYPRVVEKDSDCPRRLPLDAGQVTTVYRAQVLLDRALQQAAQDAGTGYVDVFAASARHDVCSARPWVNGSTTDRTRAAAFHPLPAGMRAVADLVLTALDDA